MCGNSDATYLFNHSLSLLSSHLRLTHLIYPFHPPLFAPTSPSSRPPPMHLYSATNLLPDFLLASIFASAHPYCLLLSYFSFQHPAASLFVNFLSIRFSSSSCFPSMFTFAAFLLLLLLPPSKACHRHRSVLTSVSTALLNNAGAASGPLQEHFLIQLFFSFSSEVRSAAESKHKMLSQHFSINPLACC